MYGWRAKIGLLVPMTNTTIEPEFNKLAPDGVSIFAARLPTLGVDTVESLLEMQKHLEEACDRLAINPDIIVYGCTTGSLVKGVGFDKEIARKIEDTSRVPATTTSTAVVDAFLRMKIKQIVIGTPYNDELNEREVNFLEKSGFTVLNVKGLNLSPSERREKDPIVAYRLAKEVFHPRADGVFISCTNFRTIEIIEKLERDLNRPVITSNQATMWKALRIVGINDHIKGYGKLLMLV